MYIPQGNGVRPLSNWLGYKGLIDYQDSV